MIDRFATHGYLVLAALLLVACRDPDPATRMLRRLDSHHVESFPVLSNLNYDLITARLHGFAGPDGAWALVFQEAVYWGGGDGLVTIERCFGACVEKQGMRPRPLKFATYEHDRRTGQMRVETLKVRGVAVDAATLKLPKHPLIRDTALAVGIALLDKHRESMFADDATIAKLVKPNVRQIVKLDDWPHPDVTTDPSDSPFFQRLARTLTSEGKTPLGEIAGGNVNWRYWLEKK